MKAEAALVDRDRLAATYLSAKSFVRAQGFGPEIAWQESRALAAVDETPFLAEAAWVILSSGMREKVVRSKFPAISSAFLHWEGAVAIESARDQCRSAALQVFNHDPKIDGILEVAAHVAVNGFDCVRTRLGVEGPDYLRRFPFLGPVTALHLAKNLGMDIVKPDRHLVRIAGAAGFETPETMCKVIARGIGERLSVVDVVLWRFATLRPDYIAFFA